MGLLKTKNKIKQKIRKKGPLYRLLRNISRKLFLGPEDYYVVLDSWKAVFFYLPKNGNTSLKKVLYKKIYGKETKRLHHDFPKTRHRKPNKKSYFKFAFVRNPYDRLVSAYRDKICSPGQLGVINSQKEFYIDMPFKEFVKVVSKTPDKNIDRHFRSQSWFLEDKKGNLIPNFIGKFENFEKDYKDSMKRLGFTEIPKLEHKNKSMRNLDYREYYDEDTKKLVEKRYKEDLELFGYSF